MIGRFWKRRAKAPAAGRTFLSRLARDKRGNVLVIAGASLLPLLCLIGSGIDVSRTYMAGARLQEACDAASLAGRRAMTSGSVDQTVTDEAIKFFNFNFPQGTYQTHGFTPSVTGGPNQTVIVSARTTIPTTIMRIFGFSELPLSVTCNAKQDFVNTDIVLVLDTTGSMLDDVNNNAVNGGATSKIAGLRSAVLALYDQLAPVQAQLEAAGLRMRYGIVPYSSAVNVGGLVRTLNPAYLNDSAGYQTRAANYNTAVYAPSGTATVTNETFGSTISATNCAKYGYNQSFSGFTPNPSGEPIAATTLTYYQPSTWGGSTTISGNGNKTCVRTKTVYPAYTTRYAFSGFTYMQRTVDTSGYKTGSATRVAVPDRNNAMGGTVAAADNYDPVYVAANATPTFAIPRATTNGVLQVPAVVAGTSPNATTVQTAVSTENQTWPGCIEERQTVNTITTSTNYTIPSGAYDLNLDLIPNSTTPTRWTPHWRDLEFLRNGTSEVSRGEAYVACPSPAVALKAWTHDELSTYLNGLVAIGGTYHDIGMIWGGRLISPNGIFSASNPNTFGAMPVTRHIIFLTDGAMAPNTDTYTSYGIETLDQRVTGSSSANGQLNDHKQRFLMTCNAIKSMNVSIWVIGFAQALDSSLTTCATNANQAVTSNSQADLIAKFVEIGKNIGALRLTQ